MEGKTFRQTAPRHTHRQWLAFLKKLHAETPPNLTLALGDRQLEHSQASKGEFVDQMAHKAHGLERIVLHYTPTSSSWMNLVEGFFRDLTVDCVRDGSFTSIEELSTAIEAYLLRRDLIPVRYQWKAEGKASLEKIQRAIAAHAAA